MFTQYTYLKHKRKTLKKNLIYWVQKAKRSFLTVFYLSPAAAKMTFSAKKIQWAKHYF